LKTSLQEFGHLIPSIIFILIREKFKYKLNKFFKKNFNI